MNKLLIVFLFFLTWSCQKKPLSEPVSLASEFSQRFSSCAPADGGLKLGFDDSSEMLPVAEQSVKSIQLDWLSRGAGAGWEVEVTDPLGRQVLKFGYANQNIELSGPAKQKMPKISVSKEGFLQVEGYEVGLKAVEIPCLLAFKIPRQWSLAVEQKNQADGRDVLLIRPDHRKIKLVFFAKNYEQNKRSCVQISWSRFLGLQQSKIMWCKYIKNGTNYSYLYGEGLGTLFWEDDGY